MGNGELVHRGCAGLHAPLSPESLCEVEQTENHRCDADDRWSEGGLGNRRCVFRRMGVVAPARAETVDGQPFRSSPCQWKIIYDTHERVQPSGFFAYRV